MKDKKSIGYILGTALGAIITICAMVLLIAITCKLIIWII